MKSDTIFKVGKPFEGWVLRIMILDKFLAKFLWIKKSKSILNVRREGREVSVVQWGSEYWNSLVPE